MAEVSKRRSSVGIIVALAIVGMFFLFLLMVMMSAMQDNSGDDGIGAAFSGSGGRLGLLEINGVIEDARPWLKDIDNLVQRKHVRGLLVRINSPGGSAAASQEIYHELRRLQAEEELPVIASLGDIAASGGYYIASGCGEIVSNAGTLTGSIGVIMQSFNLEGLMKEIHIEPRTLKAGKMKDAGSPFRPLTGEERKYFEEMLANVHAQFIRDVRAGRGERLSEEPPLEELADGRVFTGEQAQTLGLVDRLGNFNEAVKRLAEQAGIEGRPRLVQPERPEPNLFDLLMTSMAQGVREGVRQSLQAPSGPRPMFLYSPAAP